MASASAVAAIHPASLRAAAAGLLLVLVLGSAAGSVSAAPSALRGGGDSAAAQQRREARCRCTNTSDACWPAASKWASLNASVGGRLLVPESEIQACIAPGHGGVNAEMQSESDACQRVLRRANEGEYFNQDRAGAYQVVGWEGAWLAVPSTYAVAAEKPDDVVAAVRFAYAHNLRLVVKNTGHDYLGRSSAANASLLIWTHHLLGTEWSPDNSSVTVQAGVVWGSLYLEAQERGRYVQGGWCPSVGAVGGFTLGGGYGPFSKTFGSGADNLLAATVVLASGEVVTASSTSHPDLFWALRGGGGGTFGVVTSMTYRTHPAPTKTGVLTGLVECQNEASFARLVRNFTALFADELSGQHWGGIVTFGDTVHYSRKSIKFYLPYVGKDRAHIKGAFSTFSEQVTGSDGCWWQHGLSIEETAMTTTESGERVSKVYPFANAVTLSDGRWYDPANIGELNIFYSGYTSQYMPLSELQDADTLASKLVDLSEFGFDMHLNKALGNGSGIWAGENTSYHPVSRESATLILRSSSGMRGMDAGIHGYNSVLPHSRKDLEFIVQSMPQPEWRFLGLERQYAACANATALTEDELAECWAFIAMRHHNATAQFNDVIAPSFRRAFPHGSYINEADYWQPEWQDAFWGANYEGLRRVKTAVDPEGMFFCHHCVGSEHWDRHGNCRV